MGDMTNGDLSKCSMAIPGLHHKLCVDDNGQQIRFSAATNDEMDNTYYQLYGYDEYYYNNNYDEDLYNDLEADYMDNYNYGDYGYYNNYDDIQEIQRRQLSSEEDKDAPFGYDHEEYGDDDNGYDDQHPMDGFVDKK